MDVIYCSAHRSLPEVSRIEVTRGSAKGDVLATAHVEVVPELESSPMKPPNLKNWPEDNCLDGLLLFAQGTVEMLANDTLDTYKLPTLNSNRRCLELLTTIKDVRSGAIRVENIPPIVQELVDSLKSDAAAQNLLGSHFRAYINDLSGLLSNFKAHLSEIESDALYLKGLFGSHSYLEELKGLLLGAVADPTRIDEVIPLARNLVTELVHEGYTRDGLWNEANQFFFGRSRSQSYTSPDDLREFLDRFDFQQKKWDVVAKVSRGYSSIENVLPQALVLVGADAHSSIMLARVRPAARSSARSERNFLSPSMEYPYFVICSGIQALDALGAKLQIEEVLRKVAAISLQYYHRQFLGVHRKMAVYQGADAPLILSTSISPMVALRGDVGLQELPAKVGEIVRIVSQAPERFLRTMELHATASDARASSNQFLTEWTALEAFLPHEQDEARIESIVSLLQPVLCRRYIPKLIDDLRTSLTDCTPAELAEALGRASHGQTEAERLAAILSLETSRSVFDDLVAATARNVLLRQRLIRLRADLSSVANIASLIKHHWDRVNWHLHRLYRTRNILVHTGEQVLYLSALTENLHSYLDTLVYAISEGFMDLGRADSMEAVLRHMKLEYKAYEMYLDQQKKCSPTPETFGALLQFRAEYRSGGQ